MDESDRELIDSFLNGSDAAFERLYNRYQQQLYGYLRSMLRNADADDVFQQTWIRVCSALPGCRTDGSFRPWLFRIARNLAIDAIRRNNRRGGIECKCENADLPSGTEPWHSLAEEELRRKLEEALDELAPEQLAVFRMRQNEISFRVIAEGQHCAVQTAVMRMQYALKKLKRKLEEFRRKE
ncbi:MAG: sigma-70 family RNA polymerase sigma factor [Lentisphaeria bacterium]|nr:sigma-70 family RNA polymerase sigma factor [Lentisphaeria bacterium]